MWLPHIDYLCSALSSKISLLRQLATYVTTDALKKFYQGSVKWSGTSSTNLDRILKLQKRAARIILHADYTTRSSTMFQELGWQPVHKRLSYNKAALTYIALNSQTPEYITNLRPISKMHSRSLRSSANGTLMVPMSRTSLFDKSFTCSAPRLWNSLPVSEIRHLLIVLKIVLKMFFNDSIGIDHINI